MDPKCQSINESLRMNYSLNGLDEFFSIESVNPTYVKQIQIDIRPKVDGKAKRLIGTIMLLVTSRYIEIGILERYEPSPNNHQHKGIIQKIIKLIICKAVELNLPITFIAVPATGKNIEEGRPNINNNKTKLYRYYNKIGFTRKNNNSSVNNNNKNRIFYNTPHATLKEIVNSWPPSESSGGSEGSGGSGSSAQRKTRKSKKH